MDQQALPQFDRKFLDSKERLTCIGSGSIGGKARGLAFVQKTVTLGDGPNPSKIEVNIPRLTVMGTNVFSEFLRLNQLDEVAYSDLPDDRIAQAFQCAQLPPEFVGDLRALISQVHTPLAVRSSSMLEDAMYRPFAGVYATKMIPNNQPDADSRFCKLEEAIKFVYASTFFRHAKAYLRTVTKDPKAEKMAIIIQEVVGQQHADRFYPHLSGVARSYNFYPSGRAKSEDGVVELALGLGKTIVDGGLRYTYCPAYPTSLPYKSIGDLLKNSQTRLWAVNVGRSLVHAPIQETEYMTEADLAVAEEDQTLQWLASTYDPASDCITPGTDARGSRIVNFAPLLIDNVVPLNDTLRWLLARCEATLDSKVEIEFAMTLDQDRGVPARLGFLQARPMVVCNEQVHLDPAEMVAQNTLLASNRVLGNGTVDTIRDIVYVRPDRFEARLSQQVAVEVADMNDQLMLEGRPYLLIGFGRWGSSDPWLGIPVAWGHIAGARAIVEATLPSMNPDFSQGSHFFHNLSCFRILYFSVSHAANQKIDWDWLASQRIVSETELLRHIRLPSPLRVKVDGRNRRGVVVR